MKNLFNIEKNVWIQKISRKSSLNNHMKIA